MQLSKVRKNYTIKVVLIKLYMYVEVFVYLPNILFLFLR